MAMTMMVFSPFLFLYESEPQLCSSFIGCSQPIVQLKMRASFSWQPLPLEPATPGKLEPILALQLAD